MNAFRATFEHVTRLPNDWMDTRRSPRMSTRSEWLLCESNWLSIVLLWSRFLQVLWVRVFVQVKQTIKHWWSLLDTDYLPEWMIWLGWDWLDSWSCDIPKWPEPVGVPVSAYTSRVWSHVCGCSCVPIWRACSPCTDGCTGGTTWRWRRVPHCATIFVVERTNIHRTLAIVVCGRRVLAKFGCKQSNPSCKSVWARKETTGKFHRKC